MADTINGLENIPAYLEGIARDFHRINFDAFGRLELYELAHLHEGYFATETGPDGVRWPALALSTIERKGHDTILVDTGRLINSLTTNSGGSDGVRDVIGMHDVTNIVFGTYVEYSGYHDRPWGSRPARVHVGLTERFIDGFVDRLLNYTINELRAA